MAKTGSGKDTLEEKKAKVMQKRAKVSMTSVLIIAVVVIMAAGGFWLSRSGTPETEQVKSPKQIDRVTVSGPVDYTQGRVDMTNIDYTTKGDNVVISLDEVKKNKFVRFEFRSPKINVKQRNFAGEPLLPVMAMVAPSGKLLVAVSYCEPCRATTFHTEKDSSLTCNICGTKWDLETLIAWSGACQAFPPDEVKVAVKDGKVLIPKGYLESWEPREEL